MDQNTAPDPAPAAPGATGVRQTTAPDGVTIRYEVHGAGTPALVFVHGWSCDRSYWQAQIEPFSRGYQVVAVDLGGHGESGFGREAWTIKAFGEDVAAVAGALGLERMILIGHSMGGDVITEAARRLPGRVAGLIWVDAYKRLGTPRTPEQAEALLAPIRADFGPAARKFVRGMFWSGADEALVERVAADMSAAPPEVALQALEAAVTYDHEVTAALQELRLPTLALNPDNAPTDIDSMRRYGVEVVIMPGASHFLMMEDPDRFNPLLAQAVAEIVRRAG